MYSSIGFETKSYCSGFNKFLETFEHNLFIFEIYAHVIYSYFVTIFSYQLHNLNSRFSPEFQFTFNSSRLIFIISYSYTWFD